MLSDGVLCLVAGLLEVFVFMLFLFLYTETAEAYGQDAEAMVAGIVGVTRDELVIDNVFEELAAVELLEVGTVLPQLLEKAAKDDVSSFLVGLLMEGVPDLGELVAVVPGESA